MTENQQQISRENKSNDEIDLIELALKIWGDRKIIYKTVAVFFVLGLLVAFGGKKEYKAETSFILEDNSGGSRMSGLLSQFGGLAGLNLSSAQLENMINPELFKNIIKSPNFMLEVLYSDIRVEKYDTTISVFDYLNEFENSSLIGSIKKYTLGLPNRIIELIIPRDQDMKAMEGVGNVEGNLLKLSFEENEIIEKLKGRISLQLDEKTGIIRLEVELPDAQATAELTKTIYVKLTDFLIDYKVEKSRNDFEFIQARYTDAKGQYLKAQKKLAEFRDKNKNVTSAYYRTEEERLQNEYQIAYNVYNSLAQQLEQANIKIHEKMPVFKVLDEVQIPIEKYKPKRSLTMIICLILGFSIGVSIILIQDFYFRIKSEISNRLN